MIIWMLYDTDGDGGYYNIRLFHTQAAAEAYRKAKGTSYSSIKKIEVHS